MKKMVKLLSVIMLVAMCFSFMAASAYAAPVVVVPGSGSTGSNSSSSAKSGGTVFSYGTDPFTQAALEDGKLIEGSIVTEKDGRIKGDGRDNSLFVENVELEVSDTVKELVAKYAGDVNINNDTNPYYFMWLMNKFVNGEIDYSNPDNELETARALFAEFVDEAAKSLAVAAASNQVLEENPEMKEAVKAVVDEEVEQTLDQEVLAEQAEKQIEQVAEEIISDINNIEGASATPAASKAKTFSVRSAIYSGDAKVSFKKTAVELHNVIVANGEITVNDQQSLDTNYKGDIVFDFKNCTINTNSVPLVIVNSGLFKFKNGIINGSFLQADGGSIILDNMKINVPAGGQYAVYVNGGAYVDMVRSNYFTSKSTTNAVVAVAGGNVIFDGYINTSTAPYGIDIDGGAKVTKNGGDILYSEPATDIFAPTGVHVKSGTFVFNGGNITGTAPAAGAVGAAIYVEDASGNNVSVNDGSTGCILSAYNAAIYSTVGNGVAPTNATVAVADVSYLKDASGYKSDISDTVNVCTVNGIGYTSLKEAVASADAQAGIPVQIINDVEIADTAAISAGNVVVNGNGYTIYSTKPVFDVSAGSLVLDNITLDIKDTAGENGIQVSGGTAALNNVTVDNCSQYSLYVSGGDVTVDGFASEESGPLTRAIAANGTTGSVVVYDMTTNSGAPVELATGNTIPVTIYQSKSRVDSTYTDLASFKGAAAPTSDVTKCVASGSSEALTGGYYYINAREVTTEIISGGAEDGSYLLYEKGVANQTLQLKSNDAVQSIEAIGSDGKHYPINFKPSADYKTVTLTDANLQALPAGEYTLDIKYQNSGAIKVPLYVMPETKQTDNKKDDTDLYLTTYDKDKGLWKYDAQSHKDGWIKIPKVDVPKHIGIGPDRDSVIWLSDAIMDGAEDDGTKWKYDLMHDDLDHLGNGTNYVWLDYGTYWVPVKFEVYNAAATITPTTTDWNKIDGDKVFTVWPDVLTVKLNGQSLENDKEYTYKDGKLTLKASFLKTLANGNYQMEVSTSKGGVFVDLSIGEVLRPKTIDYHVYGGNKPITFVGSNKIDYTKGIWIGKQNPVQIPEEYYTINDDHTFTLSAAYLNRLTTLGTYYISAYVGGQYCTTTFRIISASQAAYNPSTGDNSNIGMWIIILVLAAVVIVVILIPTLKKKTGAEAKAKSGKKDE